MYRIRERGWMGSAHTGWGRKVAKWQKGVEKEGFWVTVLCATGVMSATHAERNVTGLQQ
jgi:hypothetical protein